MKWFVILLTFYSVSSFAEYLFVEGGKPTSSAWTKFSSDNRLNLRNLFQKLALSPTGRELIKLANKKAKSQGVTLYDVVVAGRGSLTDTTLVRKFNRVHFDKVTYETNSKVYINKDLNHHDAVLDLAHELTHYVHRSQFNPYVKNFSLVGFIKSTIEGKGGEVEAFMMECQVQSELFKSNSKARFNCDNIKRDGHHSFSAAKEHFYQVGNYFDSFKSVLNKYGLLEKFPELSSQKESFVSGVYGIPYPVAAFEEYLTVLNKACENDRRRIAIIKEDNERAPAGLTAMEESYQARCNDFIN